MFLVLCPQASLVEASTPIIAIFLCCVCPSLCFLCFVCRRLWRRPSRPSLPFSCAVLAQHCVSCAVFAGVSGGGLHAHHRLFLYCVCPSLCFLCFVCRRLWWRPSRLSLPFSCAVFAHHCVSCAVSAGVSGGGLYAHHCLFKGQIHAAGLAGARSGCVADRGRRGHVSCSNLKSMFAILKSTIHKHTHIRTYAHIKSLCKCMPCKAGICVCARVHVCMLVSQCVSSVPLAACMRTKLPWELSILFGYIA